MVLNVYKTIFTIVKYDFTFVKFLPIDGLTMKRYGGFPEGKKGLILSAALQSLLELGYGGTTLAEVSRRSGLSKPLIRYHFETPKDMLLEIMVHWARSGQQLTLEHLAAKAGNQPEIVIAEICEASYIWAERLPEFGRLSPVLILAAQSVPEVAAFQRQVMQQGLARIDGLLRLTTIGKNMDDEGRRLLAMGIHCQMVGSLLYVLGQGLKDWEPIKKMSKAAILFMLHYDPKS